MTKIDMLKEFDRIEKMNVNYIKEHHNFSSMAMIYTDKRVQILALIWKNQEEKEIMKMLLKKTILEQKTQFYIFNADTLSTIIKPNGEKKVYDVLITLLCSPNKTILKTYFHDGKGNPIEKPSDYDEDISKAWNSWNVWNEGEYQATDKIIQEYNKFKSENPERFRSIK